MKLLSWAEVRRKLKRMTVCGHARTVSEKLDVSGLGTINWVRCIDCGHRWRSVGQ